MLNSLQDRFHPVTLHHVKPHHHPAKPHHLIQPPADPDQAIFSSPQSFDNFRNEFEFSPEDANQEPESHAGEIIPGLVSQKTLQSLDFPVSNLNDYTAYIETSTSTPSSTPSSLVNLSGDSSKTVYVPWIYLPPSKKYKETHEHQDTDKPLDHEHIHSKVVCHENEHEYQHHEHGYPKSTYLPPKSNYLSPSPSYLPPKPNYLPPDPHPTYLPPNPGYLPPPTPKPGYSYSSPPIKEEEEKEKATEFTYFFLGRKLWYIPLYFSIYFVLYVGYLVMKAIARHKIKFPHLLHNAAVVSGRDLIQLGLYNSRDFGDMVELLNTVTRATENNIYDLNVVLLK